ncbi:MAG: hypothetical protein JOY53_05670 [Acidobacteriaceae bacterium]|nr:hypothetical protein [Acidobacteriaceae bacterium]
MTQSNTSHSALTLDDIRAISTAFANYTQKSITEGLWKRPDVSALPVVKEIFEKRARAPNNKG